MPICTRIGKIRYISSAYIAIRDRAVVSTHTMKDHFPDDGNMVFK